LFLRTCFFAGRLHSLLCATCLCCWVLFRNAKKKKKRKKKKKKRARSDEVEIERPMRGQDSASSEGMPATAEEDHIRDSGKRQKSGSNNCRSHKDGWKERIQYEVIKRDISQGCSCEFKCVSKMSLGRVYQCRTENMNRSSAELSSHCLSKLDQCFNSDLGTMSYTTDHGSPCCRVGLEVEQGYKKAYVTQKLKKIKKGETLDAGRGGQSLLTLHENFGIRIARILLSIRMNPGRNDF